MLEHRRRDLSIRSPTISRRTATVGITPTCTVTNPPSTGSLATDPDAVRVDLSVQKQLSFSGMFMSSAPTIGASATATIVPSGKYCVVSLENTATTGINATGNADVDLGCGMITNSISMTPRSRPDRRR